MTEISLFKPQTESGTALHICRDSGKNHHILENNTMIVLITGMNRLLIVTCTPTVNILHTLKKVGGLPSLNMAAACLASTYDEGFRSSLRAGVKPLCQQYL